jgi:predicted O-linked N-acetylglucosamine transferase (SPINDLY family)
VGLPELVASNVDGYVATAAALAADLDRLAALRAGMRERIALSPLRDESGFMKRFEAALRALWREWCDSRTR